MKNLFIDQDVTQRRKKTDVSKQKVLTLSPKKMFRKTKKLHQSDTATRRGNNNLFLTHWLNAKAWWLVAGIASCSYYMGLSGINSHLAGPAVDTVPNRFYTVRLNSKLMKC